MLLLYVLLLDSGNGEVDRERSFFVVVVVTIRSISRSAARMENTHQGIFPNLVVVVVVVVVVVLVVVAAWCCSCWLMHHHPHPFLSFPFFSRIYDETLGCLLACGPKGVSSPFFVHSV